MAVEHVLRCDDGLFADWTEVHEDDPSIIEQVAAAAHNGARGNHIVINEDDKAAYASLENWASPMSMGELRAVGLWWRVLVPIPPSPFPTMIAGLSIDTEFAAVLYLNSDNAVSLMTHYDGGWNDTDFVPLFTGTEWRHVRLVVVRHDTVGGAQLWDGNNLLIDDTEYDTTVYDGTPDWFHVGASLSVRAGFETCQDEFRIATTLVEAKPKRPVPRGLFTTEINLMFLKGTAQKVQYIAWNTLTCEDETGDAANHSLSLRLNGATDSSLDNSPSEVANGLYEIQLTAAELAVAGMATLFGESSTPDVVIIPVQMVLCDAATLKADATAANQLAIKAKTDRIGSVAVQVTSPVAEDGTVEIVEGDDYKGGQALSWTFENWAGPAMTSGAAVELLIMTTVSYEAGTGTAAETVAGEFSVNGTTVTITAELTAAETGALGPTPPADAFAYTYQIRCTASGGESFTPAIGAMTVKRRVDPAS